MVMAVSSAVLPITGGANLESCHLAPPNRRTSSGHQSQILFSRRKLSQLNRYRNLSVCAKSNYGILTTDGSRGGGSDFLAGFVLGGALFGTLAYVFAPQIRRSILNEDEYGFRRPKRPIYYDEDLQPKIQQTLNANISRLNAAIDNVSSRLRGGNKAVAVPNEADSEIEAAM